MKLKYRSTHRSSTTVTLLEMPGASLSWRSTANIHPQEPNILIDYYT